MMIITSAQQFINCTEAPSIATTQFDSTSVGSPESTKFIPIPPTIVAWLLQYSGSRVEHRDGFSSCKNLQLVFKRVNLVWIFRVL